MRRLVVELTDAEYTRLEQVAFTMPGADLLLLIVSRVLKSKTPAEASAKIREGVPVTELAAQVGHARKSMTLDTYSHVLLEDA